MLSPPAMPSDNCKTYGRASPFSAHRDFRPSIPETPASCSYVAFHGDDISYSVTASPDDGPRVRTVWVYAPFSRAFFLVLFRFFPSTSGDRLVRRFRLLHPSLHCDFCPGHDSASPAMHTLSYSQAFRTGTDMRTTATTHQRRSNRGVTECLQTPHRVEAHYGFGPS